MNNLKQRNLIDQIKQAAKIRNFSIKALGEAFNQRLDSNYTQSSFSRKLNNGAFNCNELEILGEILGFEVELKLID